jgi:hypothetical protein
VENLKFDFSAAEANKAHSSNMAKILTLIIMFYPADQSWTALVRDCRARLSHIVQFPGYAQRACAIA